ncbi:MAG: hypothetical protein WD649_05370 [Thermoleophilaceae bacterium]
MRDQLLGIWQDLREMRLWPVAAGLLVALVAVPIVLLKGGGDSDGGPTPTAAAPDVADLPTASLADRRTSENSDLGVFDPKDPFRPAGGYPAPPGSATAGGGAALPTPSGVPSGSGGNASAGAAASDTSGGSTAGGSSGSSSTPKSDGGTTTTRKTYTYVVDIRFGERGEVRSRKGVRRMALLPSSRNPLIVFLGVSADRRKAIFLVDSGLSQEGEGRCKPSKRFCSFLYLRTADTSDDHWFSTESGKQYSLHLSKIRRVEVKPKAKRARKAPRTSRAGVGPGALFESPVFIDEVR